MGNDNMFVEAAKEDAAAIIALRHQIWGTTYRGIYPDDMIDNFDWAWHREKELLRINDPAYSVYLLQKDDQNIGYLTISRTDGIVLQSLYILSEYQRQGIGRAAWYAECEVLGRGKFMKYPGGSFNGLYSNHR